MPKLSNIWEFFNNVEENEAKCKACSKIYLINESTTSPLRNHLKKVHLNLYKQLERKDKQKSTIPDIFNELASEDSDFEQIQERGKKRKCPQTQKDAPASPQSGPSGTCGIPNTQIRKGRKQATKPEWQVTDINQMRTVIDITKWVIEGSRPFSIVETDAFTRMMKTETNGQFRAITAKNISTKYIPLLFKIYQGTSKKHFQYRQVKS